MNAAVIPESIAQLQLQLDEIRSTRPRGKRLPDSVWQAAVELAREHGVYSVAHHLRLDYTGLKNGKRSSNPPSQGAEPVLKCGYGSSDERSHGKTTDTGRDSADCGGVCNERHATE